MENKSWDTLPHIVLNKIFKNLGESDRNSVSLVNRNWSRAFRSPQLWRKKQFKFPTDFDERPSKFASSLGEYLKELNVIVCPSRDVTVPERAKTPVNNFFEFFTILSKKPISLEKFQLDGLNLDFEWKDDRRRRKLVRLIREFLGKQSNMTFLSMNSCEASPEIGIDFLRHLAKNNSRSLRTLLIADFFIPTCEVLSSPDYKEVMGSFTNLVWLGLNYNSIDSTVLEQIVKHCGNSLEVLNIFCRKGNRMDHVIPNSTWNWVRKTCPKLWVHVDIEIYDSSVDFSHIFPSEMGLQSIGVILSTSIENQSEAVLNFNLLASHLCQFRETLVNVNLIFGCKRNLLEDGLVYLFTCFPKLKSLDFLGLNCSDETVETLRDKLGPFNLETCDIDLNTRTSEGQDFVEISLPIPSKLGVKIIYFES